MKSFLKIILVTAFMLSLGLLGNCGKKEADRESQRLPYDSVPEIPLADHKDNAEGDTNVNPIPQEKELQQKPEPHHTPPAQITNGESAAKTENVNTVARVAVEVQFNTHGADIPEPIAVKYEDKVLAKTQGKQLNLNLREKYLEKKLMIEAPYFKPVPPVIVTENATKFNINLEPLMVNIKVADSVGIYSKEVDNVQIYSGDNLIGKTDKQGVAQIRAPHVGANNLIFYKPHFFSRQAHVVKIDGKNAVVKVGLLPLKHFIRIKLLDDKNKPLKNREVELVGSGLAINSKTNRYGLVTLKSFNLKPAVEYQLHIRSLDYTNNKFTFTDNYFDESKKYIALKIPVRYSWSIRASAEDAHLALYDFSGHKVAEGTGRLDVKISRGTYKIIAKSGSVTKEELLNAAAMPHTKVVIMDECYSYAQEWNKQHPGNNHLPDEIINCLKDIHTSDPNFINSRMLLAKTAMANKQYGNAKIFYEDILRYDRSKKYDPVILYNTAQAIIFFSDNIKNSQNKLQLLEQASSNYLDNASAYMTKLPIRSRKKWIIKIEYLKGELYQRLFFHYKKVDAYELARQNANAALDAFNSFIRDYQSLTPSSSLKLSLKKDYERAVDLKGSILAAKTM